MRKPEPEDLISHRAADLQRLQNETRALIAESRRYLAEFRATQMRMRQTVASAHRLLQGASGP